MKSKPTWTFIADKGGMRFSDRARAEFKQDLLDHEGKRYEVVRVEEESKKYRAWYHASLVQLVAFYQENMDHTNWRDCEKVHGWLKQHLNADLVNVNGNVEKVAKSTKGKLGDGFTERVEEWLDENYAPPLEALDSKKFKIWRDTIYPYGGPPNYIDYLVEIGRLTRP